MHGLTEDDTRAVLLSQDERIRTLERENAALQGNLAVALADLLEERRRIRRELLVWADEFMRRGAYMDSFREALDRICPPDTPEPG